MRAILLSLLCLCGCVSCTVRGITKLPNGVELPATASLGGDHQEMMRYDGNNAGGGYMFARRNRQTESFRDATSAIVAGIGLVQGGMTQRAFNAGEVAVATGAQKATVAGQEIATRVPLAEIATKVPLAEVAAGASAGTAVRALKKR